MSTKDNLTLNPELQLKFLEGIKKVSSIIRQSYGHKGGNVSIETLDYPRQMVVNDAQHIIQSLDFTDPIERAALNFIKELSDRTSKLSGEGRKTTIIIAEEILKGGFEQKIEGMDLTNELNNLLPLVLESLDKQSTPVTLETIEQVAITSSRSKEIGKEIADIYREIGLEGIIEVEGSGTFETSHTTTTGVRFKGAGWLSPYMFTEGEKSRAVYEKPLILVTKRKMMGEKDVAPLLDSLKLSNKKDLVIFTDDMDSNVASMLVATHRAKVMNILIIKAPVIMKDYAFEDFAKCVGATILNDESGTNYKNLVDNINRGIFLLGTCDKLITDKEDTILIGISDISEHKKYLENRGDNESKLRAWGLNSKTAVLKIGAGSESELSYKRLKAEDAVNACRAAIMEGIVEGGARSFVKAVNDIPEVSKSSSILINAILSPYRQLLENNSGRDFETNGIYDATLVVKNAVRIAVSLAGTILSVKGDIRLPEKSFEDKQLEILYKKQNPF